MGEEVQKEVQRLKAIAEEKERTKQEQERLIQKMLAQQKQQQKADNEGTRKPNNSSSSGKVAWNIPQTKLEKDLLKLDGLREVCKTRTNNINRLENRLKSLQNQSNNKK